MAELLQLMNLKFRMRYIRNFFGGKQIWHIMKIRFKISEYIYLFSRFFIIKIIFSIKKFIEIL